VGRCLATAAVQSPISRSPPSNRSTSHNISYLRTDAQTGSVWAFLSSTSAIRHRQGGSNTLDEVLSAMTMKNRPILELHGVTFQKIVPFIKLVAEQVNVSAAAKDLSGLLPGTNHALMHTSCYSKHVTNNHAIDRGICNNTSGTTNHITSYSTRSSTTKCKKKRSEDI
jgi:hypothetical protein